MRSFLALTVAAMVAIGGLTAASLVLPPEGGATLAAKAKTSSKANKASRQRAERRDVPPTTGFEHQQCSVKEPCSTRNQW